MSLWVCIGLCSAADVVAVVENWSGLWWFETKYVCVICSCSVYVPMGKYILVYKLYSVFLNSLRSPSQSAVPSSLCQAFVFTLLSQNWKHISSAYWSVVFFSLYQSITSNACVCVCVCVCMSLCVCHCVCVLLLLLLLLCVCPTGVQKALQWHPHVWNTYPDSTFFSIICSDIRHLLLPQVCKFLWLRIFWHKFVRIWSMITHKYSVLCRHRPTSVMLQFPHCLDILTWHKILYNIYSAKTCHTSWSGVDQRHF